MDDLAAYLKSQREAQEAERFAQALEQQDSDPETDRLESEQRISAVAMSRAQWAEFHMASWTPPTAAEAIAWRVEHNGQPFPIPQVPPKPTVDDLSPAERAVVQDDSMRRYMAREIAARDA